MIGVQLGAYRVLYQIGEGSMGSVWLAQHTLLGSRAAIKVLHPAHAAHGETVSRFFNEARAATAIRDPGIVQVYDVGRHTDGSAYLVMELLEGETLDRRLARTGTLDVRDALRITRQLATALGAAHARGIIHRDLKPENIVLVADPEVAGGERPKLLDFGVAKLAGAPPVTQAYTVVGTPVYMSPEQCACTAIDHRADIYALGGVLYTLLTGIPPFDGAGMLELIAQHLNDPPPRPSLRNAEVSPEVDALVVRCLAKSPADRFATAHDVALALAALLARAPHDVPTLLGHSALPAATPTLIGLPPSEPPAARDSTRIGRPATPVARPSDATRVDPPVPTVDAPTQIAPPIDAAPTRIDQRPLSIDLAMLQPARSTDAPTLYVAAPRSAGALTLPSRPGALRSDTGDPPGTARPSSASSDPSPARSSRPAVRWPDLAWPFDALPGTTPARGSQPVVRTTELQTSTIHRAWPAGPARSTTKVARPRRWLPAVTAIAVVASAIAATLAVCA